VFPTKNLACSDKHSPYEEMVNRNKALGVT
jgi:hypothetical protein